MATILIVDDLAANRTVLVTALQDQGHRLLEAADGGEGLALLRREHPDMVITDVLMPVMNGYELVRQMRLDPANRDTPVVFYTASYGEPEARALARASGVPFVLTKPVRRSEVLRIVNRVLSGQSVSQAEAESSPVTTDLNRDHLRLVTATLPGSSQALEYSNARLRAVINIGLELGALRDTEHLLQHVCVTTRDLFAAAYVTVGIVAPDGRQVVGCHSCGTGGDCDVQAGGWIGPGGIISGILETAVKERRAVRGDNPGGDPAALGLPAGHPEIHDHLVVPIGTPARVHGWICLARGPGQEFGRDDQQLLMALAGQVGRTYELAQEIQHRREVEDALRTSERLNRNLVEHLPHRILVKDLHSVIQFCNANYAKDVGLSVEQVVGTNAFDFYSAELAALYNADDAAVMSSGVMKNSEEPYEANGEQRWVHTVKVPYRDEQDQVIGVLVVFEDITDRKRLEDQFRQAQKMEAIGRLAGGVAHDFNNLLTGILGYCELLLTDLGPGDPRHDDILEIQKAGRSAAGLTRQLLAFSRKQIIEPTVFDLNDVVGPMRNLLERLIGEDVKVVLALQPGLGLVKADYGQVEQIVMNLAVNARDAMPTGGTLTIETADVNLDADYPTSHLAVQPGAYVMLTVTDTGSGMSPEVQARLFEPFFTTKEIGKGTGLGLATVHGIVKQNGGTVNVYSEVGRGTTFKVYFPRMEGALTMKDPAALAEPRPPVVRTVLMVEDAAGLRELTRRLLKRLGYTVLVAANAAEAVEIFDAHPAIDVLLTDVVMPGASGPELSRRLLALRPELKVVYMSGYTEESIVQHGALQPGIAFLHKPFTSEMLGRKLHEALDRR